MRKSFNGLSNIVREILEQDPLSGHLFVFINKKRNRLKTLWFDKDGYCILYKNLERGTFLDSLANLDNNTVVEPHVFYMLFNGLDIHHIKKRKRLDSRYIYCICTCCGKTKKCIATDESLKYEAVPEIIFIRKILRPKYACTDCTEEGVVQAKMPLQVIPLVVTVERA